MSNIRVRITFGCLDICVLDNERYVTDYIMSGLFFLFAVDDPTYGEELSYHKPY
ncbi:MAG: hypothetical protein KDH96_10245 [Candidatus Riesia sp.]|nr:hypothetical protein [Romboutsia sp.]MCB1712833.1 hypothetical protein [Candidatus Riesia sp.]